MTEKNKGLTAKPSKKNPRPAPRRGQELKYTKKQVDPLQGAKLAAATPEAAAARQRIDTETDRIIEVTLRIPFFGKREQAIKFCEETLVRILRVGIGTRVQIIKSTIRKGKM